jgi:hypothetical protein
MKPVTHKRQMYDLLSSGAFGNTIPQFSSVREWLDSGDAVRYPFWGVRTKTPGGPCRLNCPWEEVAETVYSYQPHLPNISVMISSVGRVTFMGEVQEGLGGLEVYGVEYPPKVHDWRPSMRTPTYWKGIEAKLLLRRHLNSNSLSDLEALIERYPNHVYEFSTMDRCFGTVPGRNAVVWECRQY